MSVNITEDPLTNSECVLYMCVIIGYVRYIMLCARLECSRGHWLVLVSRTVTPKKFPAHSNLSANAWIQNNVSENAKINT